MWSPRRTVLKAIAARRTRDIPVVAVNGGLQRSLREHPERDGFSALFSKPCLLGVSVTGRL